MKLWHRDPPSPVSFWMWVVIAVYVVGCLWWSFKAQAQGNRIHGCYTVTASALYLAHMKERGVSRSEIEQVAGRGKDHDIERLLHQLTASLWAWMGSRDDWIEYVKSECLAGRIQPAHMD